MKVSLAKIASLLEDVNYILNDPTNKNVNSIEILEEVGAFLESMIDEYYLHIDIRKNIGIEPLNDAVGVPTVTIKQNNWDTGQPPTSSPMHTC